MRFFKIALIGALLGIATACTRSPSPSQSAATAQLVATKSTANSNFQLTSDAFKSGEPIPSLYTCDGGNVSPPLSWSGEPQKTVTFAVIVDDPDAPAGVFTHWVLFNLPADIHNLPQGVPNTETLDNGAVQGQNSGGKIGYTGPCPPQGTHRYRFFLYALDTSLNLKPDVSKQKVQDAMQGNILGQAQILGTYQRTGR